MILILSFWNTHYNNSNLRGNNCAENRIACRDSLVFRFIDLHGKCTIRSNAKIVARTPLRVRLVSHSGWFVARDVTHRRLWVNSFSSVMHTVCVSLRQFAFPGLLDQSKRHEFIGFYGCYYGIYSFENHWNRILLRASKD